MWRRAMPRTSARSKAARGIDPAESAGYRASTCETLAREGARWFWEAEMGNYADGFVEDVTEWCSL